jgi:hypothetical protein
MNEIIDIANDFGALYEPKSALVFYESLDKDSTMYVDILIWIEWQSNQRPSFDRK